VLAFYCRSGLPRGFDRTAKLLRADHELLGSNFCYQSLKTPTISYNAILQQFGRASHLSKSSSRHPIKLGYVNRFCLLATLLLWSAVTWSADATGFTVTIPCGSPPFGSGKTDMHLHLIHFPKQRPGQELLLMMPSMLGPTGITDWVDAVGKLCSTSNRDACSNAQSARVRVLTYSAHHFLGHVFSLRISGRFEVGFSDGTSIEGTFAAKELRVKNSSQVICE